MILEKNGEAFEIRLNELSVRLNLNLANDDASGKTSSTVTLNAGTKPKKITVNGTLARDDAEHLTDLIRKAEALESDGQRCIYTISDDIADAADIRQVIFTDRLDVRERDGLHAWQVSFSLLEQTSIPETSEQRQQASQPQPQAGSASGQQVTAADVGNTDNSANNSTTTASSEQQIAEQQGYIYDLLKGLDNFLAPDSTENSEA